jgi:hypothetical protein
MGQGNFTACFVKALEVLDHPDVDVGYQRDLAI